MKDNYIDAVWHGVFGLNSGDEFRIQDSEGRCSVNSYCYIDGSMPKTKEGIEIQEHQIRGLITGVYSICRIKSGVHQ